MPQCCVVLHWGRFTGQMLDFIYVESPLCLHCALLWALVFLECCGGGWVFIVCTHRQYSKRGHTIDLLQTFQYFFLQHNLVFLVLVLFWGFFFIMQLSKIFFLGFSRLKWRFLLGWESTRVFCHVCYLSILNWICSCVHRIAGKFRFEGTFQGL